jgi:4-diphosphocytidyl-2-C-methyl-D-erythritol kinase
MITEVAKAKINLALHVLGRRADGYHMLDSIVAFTDVGDRLTFAEAETNRLTLSGPFAPMLSADDSNIVMKAVSAIEAHCGGKLPAGVSITLEKNLPIASGIGGGSADAAAVLRGLTRLFGLRIADQDMQRIALELGADVPVCFGQRYCRMQGVGNEIEPLGTPRWPAIVLVNPRISQLTQAVFKELGLEFGQRFRSGIVVDKPEHWRNDLQLPAVKLLPEIETLLSALKQLAPAQIVRMSGSGATCFVLCESKANADAIAAQVCELHPSWWTVSANLG